MSDWVRVLDGADLAVGVPTGVELSGGRAICLVRAADGVHAFDDFCPHRGTPLSWGSLDGFELTCAAHTWQWDVRDGSLQRLRAPDALVLHEARETEDGGVELKLSATPPYGGAKGERMRKLAIEATAKRGRPMPAPRAAAAS